MHKLLRLRFMASMCLGCLPAVVGAQQLPDMDLMAKWSAVAVVHYAVVGEYAGDPIIIRGAQGMNRTARVTDRVEVSFDWNQNETALVGTPAFKNFPSSVAVTSVAGCPAARIAGAYDHMEILSVGQMSSVLQIAAKRTSPPGSIPVQYPGESTCGETWDDAKPKVEPADIMLLVPPTLYFGMPAAAGATLSISPDRKVMILVDKNNGWTWTYTPTPVK